MTEWLLLIIPLVFIITYLLERLYTRLTKEATR